MANSLQGRCDANKPVIYTIRSKTLVIAPPHFWPTYWIAKHRLDSSQFAANRVSLSLSMPAVQVVLLQHGKIRYAQIMQYDEQALRTMLATQIYQEKIKVYVITDTSYMRSVVRSDSHLSMNCRAASAQINTGEESIENQLSKLAIELSDILVNRRIDKIRDDDIYWSNGSLTRGAIVLGSVIFVFADSIVALAKLGVVIVKGFIDIQKFYAKTLYRLATGDFEKVQNDLARLTDSATETIDEMEAKIKAGYEIIAPVLGDAPSRQLLYDFMREYVDGTSVVDNSTFKISLTIEVLLVIGTLGAGAVVVAARLSQRVGQFTVRALKYIVELSRAFRKLNQSRIIEAPAPVKRIQGPNRGAGSAKATKTPEQRNDDIINQVSDKAYTNGPDLPKVNVPDKEVIHFGQRRIGPKFGDDPKFPHTSKKTLDEVAKNLKDPNHPLTADDLPITVFRDPKTGLLVSQNTRTRAVLAEAGLEPTKVDIIDLNSLSKRKRAEYLNRLVEQPVLEGNVLPSTKVPMTPSKKDPTIMKVIEIK